MVLALRRRDMSVLICDNILMRRSIGRKGGEGKIEGNDS